MEEVSNSATSTSDEVNNFGDPQFIESVNNRFQPALKAIEAIQNDYTKERLALELKYQNILNPSFEKRSQIICDNSKGEGPTNKFWVNVLASIPALSEAINDKDNEALNHLTNIKVTFLDSLENLGYQITFSFEENEFFENKELVKTIYNKQLFASGDQDMNVFAGTKIEWKSEEKNLCAHNEKSFFNFFNPETGVKKEEDLTKEESATIQKDSELAEIIRSKIQYRAIEYFTGELTESDGKEDDEEGDE